jgi:hypothetical protein
VEKFGHDDTIERFVAHRAGAQTKPDATCHTVLFARSNQLSARHSYRLCRRRWPVWRGGRLLIAACLVGVTALFRWIEVNYGLFSAFGAIGALLLVAAAICAVLAVRFLTRPPPQFLSLASRLRVAIRAHSIHPDQVQPALASVNASSATVRRIKSGPRPGPEGQHINAGLASRPLSARAIRFFVIDPAGD